MSLDLRNLFLGEVDKVDFDQSFDFTDDDGVKITSNVRGSFTSKSGIIRLNADLSYNLEKPCDRCLEMTHADNKVKISCMLATEDVGSDSDYVAVDDDFKLDIESLVWEEINLNLGQKLLCKDDCKGICQQCGCNLNEKSCDCTDDYIDPRLEVLKQLLKKD